MTRNTSDVRDYYTKYPKSIYSEMDTPTKTVVILKQLFIVLVLMPATLALAGLAWYYWATTIGASAPDMGDPLLNLIGVFAFPIILFLFMVRPIFRKLNMYRAYYIPYSAVNDKGRAVIKHYRAQKHIFGLMGCNGQKFGRVAPKSGANIFNIPYEYARECYWEHIKAGGKVSNCPKLLLEREHESSMLSGLGNGRRVFMFQAACDVTQTENFKQAAQWASKIVNNS